MGGGPGSFPAGCGLLLDTCGYVVVQPGSQQGAGAAGEEEEGGAERVSLVPTGISLWGWGPGTLQEVLPSVEAPILGLVRLRRGRVCLLSWVGVQLLLGQPPSSA